MFYVGITGGIGSGKTMITRILSSFGIPIYNADIKAKNIVNTNSIIQKQIIALLGKDSYKNNIYQTEFVAKKIFADKHLLQKLNHIIHPAVFADFAQWKNQHPEYPYIVKEASILFESGSYKDCDFIVGISSPKALRIKRIQESRHLTNTDIEHRMQHQLPEQELLPRCNAVIDNSSDKLLVPQVIRLHQQILQEVQQKNRDCINL